MNRSSDCHHLQIRMKRDSGVLLGHHYTIGKSFAEVGDVQHLRTLPRALARQTVLPGLGLVTEHQQHACAQSCRVGYTAQIDRDLGGSGLPSLVHRTRNGGS